MRNPHNILRHEITGLNVDIRSISGESYKLHGVVHSETRNMFLIRDSSNNIKQVPKNSIILTAQLDDGSVVKIDGNLMTGRPEERIKKRHKISFKF
ncbi:MAG: hypothetical protein BWK75_01105 [Candidatus Altiarchaeales archaeon A3]|nr:MAG: hypothetical protein BWK75_01105 [Candidatus Altiarchaeales archaeon A3]